MANLCGFKMALRGESSSIQAFMDAMEQKNEFCMGQGASLDTVEWLEGNFVQIDGYCKWSIQSALHRNAIRMKKDLCSGNLRNLKESLTFREACKKYSVIMEVYSSESGEGFQEHYVCNENGELIVEQYEDYAEVCLDDYSSKEEAEKELETSITDEEWECGYASVGGFPSWEFSI